MDNYKVYCLTNDITKEKYIGVTKQELKKRFKNGKGYKPNTKINQAILKYGWKNFSHCILFETNNKEKAGKKEIEYIKLFNTIKQGYNNATGGFINYTQTVSERQKQNMSISHKGQHSSPKTEFKKGQRSKAHLMIIKPVYCVELDKFYDSIIDAEKDLNISHHVWDCIKGKRNKCGGYHWKYEKEVN